MSREAKLISGPVGKQIILLTLPMMLGMYAMVTFNLADTYFVSRLGTLELAAIGFSFPVVMVVGSIAIGLGIGTSSVLSQTIGGGDVTLVKRITVDGLFLAVLITVCFVILGLFTIDPLFTLLGAGPDTLPLIREYMTVWYIGMIFVIIPMVGNNAIRATGDTLTPGLIMVTASVINIILDPILIFGLFGFPRLGIAGAALATVLARGSSMVLTLFLLHFKFRMLTLFVPHISELWASWKRILFIGLPAAGTNMLHPISMAVLVRMMAEFGNEAVAAGGAGIRIESFPFMTIVAMATALIPFIGQNWGAGNYGRVREGWTFSVKAVAGWGIFCFVMLFIFASPIASVFAKDPLVEQYLSRYLQIIPLSYGLGLMAITAGSLFNAVNRPWTAALINFVRLFALLVPLAWLGGLILGYDGLLSGISAANILTGILTLFLAYRFLDTHNTNGK